MSPNSSSTLTLDTSAWVPCHHGRIPRRGAVTGTHTPKVLRLDTRSVFLSTRSALGTGDVDERCVLCTTVQHHSNTVRKWDPRFLYEEAMT
ncbi:hypothetical protein GN956_G11647 [Arapaima gigas]